MNHLCLRILLFTITTLLVVEDFQYLLEAGFMKDTRSEVAFTDFCDEGEKEEGKENKKEENGNEEFKKKDENSNVTAIRLLTFHSLTNKNILSHASCHPSDVARELETPPPEV